MDMAKSLSRSCHWPEIYFCPAANGMCFRPDQYCDSDHGRVEDCFDTNVSNATRILVCKKENFTDLKDPQCFGACNFLFPDLSDEVSSSDSPYWRTIAIIFIILTGALLALVCYHCSQRKKQSQEGHKYSPVKFTDPEAGSDVKSQAQHQLSVQNRRDNDAEDAAAGGDASCDPVVTPGQAGNEFKEIREPPKPCAVTNQNQKEGRISAASQSSLSDDSSGSAPSQTSTGQSSTASTTSTPPAVTAFPSQMPATNASGSTAVVTSQSGYPACQKH